MSKDSGQYTLSKKLILDLAIIILVVLICSLPVLYWFGRNWRLAQDPAWYMLQGLNLAGGRGYTTYGDLPSPLRGPVMAVIIALIISILGNDIAKIVWVIRLLSALSPVMLALVVRKVAGIYPGIIAGALTAFFGLLSVLSIAFTVDAVLLLFYLISLLLLTHAARNERSYASWLLSGVSLGIAILTKETALVALPSALLASFLFGTYWSKPVLHYLGLLAILLPWWGWVYLRTGDIYLVDLGQATLSLGLVSAALLMAVVALLAGWSLRYRILALICNKSTRVVLSWILAVIWSLAMLMLLSVSVRDISSDSPLEHISKDILPNLKLWFFYPLVILYFLWRVIRDGRAEWHLYGICLLVWMPVVVIVLMMGYAPRQLMVPQSLLFGLLGCMIFDLCTLPFKKDRYYSAWLRISGIFLSLIVSAVVAFSALAHARSLAEPQSKNLAASRLPLQIDRSVSRTENWISAHIPSDEPITVILTDAARYLDQVALRDKLYHRWQQFDIPVHNLDQVSNTNICSSIECSKIIWIQHLQECSFRLLSSMDLLEFMQRSGSQYLLLPVTEADQLAGRIWQERLVDTGAFEVAYSDVRSKTRYFQGYVILRARFGATVNTVPYAVGSSEVEGKLNSCLEKDRKEMFFPQGKATAIPEPTN